MNTIDAATPSTATSAAGARPTPAAMLVLSLGPLIVLLAGFDIFHALVIRPAVLSPRAIAATFAVSLLLVCAGALAVTVIQMLAIWAYWAITAHVRGRWSHVSAPALATLAASPFLLLLARQPFIGNRYRASPVAVWGPWAVLAILAVLTIMGLWLSAKTLVWLADASSRRQWPKRLVQAGMAGAAAAILAVDTLWFAGWYPLVHTVLSAASLMLAQVLLALALMRRAWRRPIAAAVNRGVVAVALLCAVITMLWSNQTVRWRVMTGTLYASRVITPAMLVTTHPPSLAELKSLPDVPPADLVSNPGVTGTPPPAANNGVLITVDALRFDALGLYGSTKRLTPNIDAFFGNGIAFERTYSQFASTRESVRAILESRFRDEAREDTTNLVNRLRDYDYQVIAVLPTDVRTFVNLERYNFTKVAFYEDPNDVPYLLDDLLRGVPADKRFVWVHFYQPHDPYEAPPAFRSGTTERDLYDAEVRWVDDDFAKVLKIAATDDSVVMFGADHGEEFHEHGGTLHGRTPYDETLRVPLAIHVRGAAPARHPELTANVDIAPTMLAALGVPIPDDYQGYDLLRRASVAPRDRVVYSESVTNAVTALQADWKWVHWTDFDLWEAYNLGADPRELANRADEEAVMTRARPLIAAFELPWHVLPTLRRTSTDQYGQWLRDLVSRGIDGTSNLERLAAYRLASTHERNPATRQLLAEMLQAERDPAFAALAADSVDTPFAEPRSMSTLPKQMTSGLTVETLRHAKGFAEAGDMIRTAMRDPVAAVRRTAAEQFARRDGAAAAAALREPSAPDPPVIGGVLTGLAAHPADVPPGLFRMYLQHPDVDVRVAALEGVAAQEQQGAVPLLLDRRAVERSPSVVRVILDRLLALNRPEGLLALREEIAHPLLSNYARAQLIVVWNVVEEADHLADLFAHSTSTQFRTYLFNAAARLKAPAPVVRRVVENMSAHNFDPTLRARMNRFLSSDRLDPARDDDDKAAVAGQE
jgi:hypothetical protein